MLEEKSPESHAWRHLQECHPEVEKKDAAMKSNFTWEIMKRCKTSFERAVSEEVIIQDSVDKKSETNLNFK